MNLMSLQTRRFNLVAGGWLGDTSVLVKNRVAAEEHLCRWKPSVAMLQVSALHLVA